MQARPKPRLASTRYTPDSHQREMASSIKVRMHMEAPMSVPAISICSKA